MDFVATPSFIRNIDSSCDQLKQLIVPKAFVEDNPTIFCNCTSVILQVPGGSEYKVDVKTKKNSTVFYGGWKYFAEHYGVDEGYFLVFYYRGSSRFQVGIADKSNCEIDYTPFHCRCVVDNEEYEESDSDESDDDDDCRDNAAITLNKGDETVSLALERAEMCWCEGRSFTVVMNKSYISRDYRMWVPVSYCKRYLKNANPDVMLKVEMEEGRSGAWKVKLVGETGTGNSMRFGAGWKDFVRDNNLDVSDVCKFELVDPPTQTFLVHVFKD